jgi:hypothetical protein
MELFMDVVSGINPDLEGLRPCMDCCGTHWSDSHVYAL